MKAFLERINGAQHETALRVFLAIVLAHWGEHLLQAFQIYGLGWPPPEARGVLGYFFPALITSEILHYGYAVVMLVGLWVLRSSFTGVDDRPGGRSHLASSSSPHRARAAAGAVLVGHNLFDRPVPTSLLQLWVPRVELHLFYNTIVFIPMVVAMLHVPACRGRSGQGARAHGTGGCHRRRECAPDSSVRLGVLRDRACDWLRREAGRRRHRLVDRAIGAGLGSTATVALTLTPTDDMPPHPARSSASKRTCLTPA